MSQKIVELPPMRVNAADRAVAGRTKRRAEWRVAEDLACRDRYILTLLQTLSDAGIEVVDGLVAWPKWIDYTSRYEDMSPTGKLVLFRQQDGDVIVKVIQEDFSSAAIEFCIPMTGGGSSEHTHRALAALMVAMERDNARD